jgi:hypothetical protein
MACIEWITYYPLSKMDQVKMYIYVEPIGFRDQSISLLDATVAGDTN